MDPGLSLAISQLPADVQWLIFRQYFDAYVLTELGDKINTWTPVARGGATPPDSRIRCIAGFLRMARGTHEYWEPEARESKRSNSIGSVDLEFDGSWSRAERERVLSALTLELPTVVRNGLGHARVLLQDPAVDTQWADFVKYWDDEGYANVPQAVAYRITKDRAFLAWASEGGGEKRSDYYAEYADAPDSVGGSFDFELSPDKAIPWFKWIT
jgi:hypothetical protein